MKRSFRAKTNTNPSVATSPQVAIEAPRREAFKASTFMILLSIVGMLGTFALAWFVWYLVEDWKNAEHQLEKERRDLDVPSPVIGSALDYLASAKEVRSAALRAKSAGTKESFGDTDLKIEVAIKILNLYNAPIFFLW